MDCQETQQTEHEIPSTQFPSEHSLAYNKTTLATGSPHCPYNLTDVKTFAYLKAQLEGGAAMTIAGFALTNANYTQQNQKLSIICAFCAADHRSSNCKNFPDSAAETAFLVA